MATETQHCAFSDTRAFVVPNEGIGSTDAGRSEILTTQAEDGPTYIRIGIDCSDAYLREVWLERKRFPGLALEQLVAARDSRVPLSEVSRG
jgi:hypothetical protein